MAKLRKYLFDLDFGVPEPAPADVAAPLEADAADMAADAVEDLPPPPTFTEEELSLARDQAFQAGRDAGLKEAETTQERLTSLSLATISEQLQRITARQDQANETRLDEAVDVALAVVRKLNPELARHHALDEVVGVVRDCVARIDEAVRVTVRLHPDAVESVREKAEDAARACAFEGKLVMVGDTRIAPGDCRVEWGDGGAERDQARLWAEIESLIARARGLIDPVPAANDTAVAS